MTWLLLPTAIAAVPVVTSNPDKALKWVSKATATNAASYEVVPVGQLTREDVLTVDGIRLRPCTSSPTSMTDLEAAYKRADSAYSHVDEAGAQQHADEALAVVGCLTERVDTDLLANLFRLRGVIAADAGDENTAREEFRSALALDGKLEWDPFHPPTGQPWFAEEKARDRTLTVHLHFPTEAGPWLNGVDTQKTNPVKVHPGLHLVQAPKGAAVQTWWMVASDDGRLVWPKAYREDPLALLADEPGRAALEGLLAATWPEETKAQYVAHDTEVWLALKVGSDVTLSQAREKDAPVEDGGPKHPWWQFWRR